MKLFDVDVSAKYIIFELDGKEYLVQFRSTRWKGIYDISVWCGKKETDAKITVAYPPLKKIVYEMWRIWIPVWCKSKITKLRRLHKR